MTRVELTHEFIQQAAQQPEVRQELRRVAGSVKTRADMLASAEGVNMRTWVEDFIRPKGRPVANVYADDVEQEWGSVNSERHRILGRAGEGA